MLVNITRTEHQELLYQAIKIELNSIMEKAIKVLEARVQEYKEIGTEPALEYAESCQKLIKLGQWVESVKTPAEAEKVEHYDGDDIINHLF